MGSASDEMNDQELASGSGSDPSECEQIEDPDSQEGNDGCSSQEEDKEGGADDDDDGDEDDADERELMIEASLRVGRWERHENKLNGDGTLDADGKEDKGKKAVTFSATQGLAAKRQIFNPSEAFRMLSRELVDIYKRQSYEMFVDALDDDVYRWVVELSSFDSKSPLAAVSARGVPQDMREVQKRYAYSSVQLHITFKRGLHPFYPPAVDIVRPHFVGPVLGAVASHPMLLLQNWDPWRSHLQLIQEVKSFLETKARVDLSHPGTDIRLHQNASAPLESHLARLEAVCGETPLHAAAEFKALYSTREDYAKNECRLSALNDTSSNKRSKVEGATPALEAKPVYWAQGTGYGSSSSRDTKSSVTWDPKASEAAQQVRDQELQVLLERLAEDVRDELGPRPHTPPPPPPPPAARRGGAAASTSAASAAAAAAAADAAAAAQADVTQAMQDMEGPGRGVSLPPAAAPAASAAAAGGGGSGGGCRGGGCGGAGPAGPRLTVTSVLGVPGLVAHLSGSCLLPFLIKELSQTSFTDMCTRYAYYCALLSLVVELSRPCTQQLLTVMVTQKCLAAVILQTGPSAEMFIKVGSTGPLLAPPHRDAATTAVTADPQEEAWAGLELAHKMVEAMRAIVALSLTIPSPAPATADPPSPASTDGQKAAADAEAFSNSRSASAGHDPAPASTARAGSRLGTRAATAAAAALAAAQAALTSGSSGRRASAGAGAAAATAAGGGSSAAAAAATAAAPARVVDAAALEAQYVAELQPLQVDYVEGVAGATHHYRTNCTAEAVCPKARTVRVAKEMSGLPQLLPISASSSVFVRVDEAKATVWRALIVGPEDTPYSGGCFVFDIYFPVTYPNTAPLVNLRTTGGGLVRFNPNLYNCGKVGENWDANVSTMLQVLISIQSLILVPDPYFNEPGYEKTHNTDAGRYLSRDYNKVIQLGTIRYAMIDMLKHPLPEFHTVIRTHFRLRRDFIRAMLKGWVVEAQSCDRSHAGQLESAAAELDVLLRAL
ncbi:MAG: hypothetical protein WDW36_001686 [Sanguina aurantia]